ncbi:MAG TPA: YkvA family protein [Anaerolineales bacterium]|nr:YkvA family protein [Anaerolineales bacterium]
MLDRWKKRVHRLKTETYALYIAYKDPRVPWYAKALTFFVVAHTLSPIDLIPDFIPVVGYLDDLIITPLGLALAIKLIPEEVLAEARQEAAISMGRVDGVARIGMIIVVSIWILFGALLLYWVLKVKK